MNRIKILQIVTMINGGGIDAVVYNYLSHMDLSDVQIDLVAIGIGKEQLREAQFKKLGVNVLYVPKSITKRILAVKSILKKGKYDIVHSHCEFLSELYLAMAMFYGTRTRIMHSHIANAQIPVVKKIYRPLGHFIAKCFANKFFGCGIDAAISLWGKRYYDQGLCYVMNNGVDLKKFAFSNTKRADVRAQMGWQEKFVIMNVGRFMPQKNHTFLLSLFKRICETRSDCILILIGDGPLKQDMEKWCEEQILTSKVLFLGGRNDVADLLNGADCFILPSLFEGLPVVSIEAQCNGLPIVMSENVTKECGVTNLSSFVSLSSSYDDWMKKIFEEHAEKRDCYPEILKRAGFDIETEAAKLKDFYKSQVLGKEFL